MIETLYVTVRLHHQIKCLHYVACSKVVVCWSNWLISQSKLEKTCFQPPLSRKCPIHKRVERLAIVMLRIQNNAMARVEQLVVSSCPFFGISSSDSRSTGTHKKKYNPTCWWFNQWCLFVDYECCDFRWVLAGFFVTKTPSNWSWLSEVGLTRLGREETKKNTKLNYHAAKQKKKLVAGFNPFEKY